jgi:3-methyladenine DNA glycosylase/8-oxoguanine DNA glycosylase
VVTRDDARSPAYQFLAAGEPVFARLTGDYGHPDPFEWFDGGRTGGSKFAAMILHVTGQRIAAAAAAAFTVFDRVAGAADGIPQAAALLSLGRTGLRALGLSGAKADCLLALSRRQADGTVDLENMQALGDDEVIAVLTAIPGIGLWSAQAFLLRQLHRPDVLPAGDTGIRRAIAEAWFLASLPTPSQVAGRAAAWAPYRSYASALLWKSLRPPGELSDPKARALARTAGTVHPAPAPADAERDPHGFAPRPPERPNP